jgi:hypothetical protein
MKKASTSKTSSKKKITLSEFKAWLQGIEEIQPPGWSPTAEQWTMIRKKIDTIEVIATSPKDNINGPIGHLQKETAQRYMVQGKRPQTIEVSGPPVPSTLAREATAQKAQQAPSGVHVKGDRIVTPNIDTTNGYQTSFE